MDSKKELARQLIDAFMEFKKTKPHKAFNSELNKTETMVLFLLSGDKDIGFNPSLLSDKVGLSRSSITIVLNSLEEGKYIERVLDKEDRRRMKVVLTKKGEDLVKQGQEKMYEHIYQIIDKLGEQDSIELIRIVKKIFEKENNNEQNN